jgi:hypothetical protein
MQAAAGQTRSKRSKKSKSNLTTFSVIKKNYLLSCPSELTEVCNLQLVYYFLFRTIQQLTETTWQQFIRTFCYWWNESLWSVTCFFLCVCWLWQSVDRHATPAPIVISTQWGPCDHRPLGRYGVYYRLLLLSECFPVILFAIDVVICRPWWIADNSYVRGWKVVRPVMAHHPLLATWLQPSSYGRKAGVHYHLNTKLRT